MSVRLKAVAEVHAGLSPPSNDVNTDGIGTPFLQGNAEFGSETPTPQYWTTSPRRISQDGDILISVRAPVGAINRSDQRYALGRGIAAVRPKSVNSRFLWWAAGLIAEQLRAAARGSTYEAVVGSDVENTRLVLPDPLPQALIADFLDRETHRIDALADAKRRMIDRLQEKRASLTLDAATGGFDHTTSRETSVPWAPSLPVHWREAMLNKVARMGSGHTPSRSHPEWWEDATIPWVTTGEVHQIRNDRIEYVTETREKISRVGLANSAAVVHPKDTVFLSRTAASAGFSGIMGTDMATSQDVVTWACGSQVEPRFLLLCLRAMRKDLLERLAQGSTHKTIYMPDVSSIKVPIPPLEEQRSIVERFWRIASTIDATTDRLTQQLNLLAEYRQALITQAVTGQLDEATLKGDKPVEEAVGVIRE